MELKKCSVTAMIPLKAAYWTPECRHTMFIHTHQHTKPYAETPTPTPRGLTCGRPVADRSNESNNGAKERQRNSHHATEGHVQAAVGAPHHPLFYAGQAREAAQQDVFYRCIQRLRQHLHQTIMCICLSVEGPCQPCNQHQHLVVKRSQNSRQRINEC
jgi:hypothetical protein